MSTLALMVAISLVMWWVGHVENDNISQRKLVKTMVKADLKAQRKRGDIFTQGRRGNYRW